MSDEKIYAADFVMSAPSVEGCPKSTLPEFAFIGRSNVGKSSLINALTNKKGLAKTSSTPGKTRLINYFIIDKKWHLVDLPGYGYAKMGHAGREKLAKIIEGYVLRREPLTSLFVLIDSRLEPQNADIAFINNCGAAGIPIGIVFTKSDKCTNTELQKNIARFKKTLLETWDELPMMFVTSAEKRSGLSNLLEYIQFILKG